AGQIGGLGGLDPVDDVEDHLTLVHLDLEVLQVAAGLVAPPDPEVTLRTHQFSPFMLATAASYSATSSSVMYLASSARSNSASSSGRIAGTGSRVNRTSPSGESSEQTRLMRRHCGSIVGKSSRVWPPRDSSRSSAAFAVHSETTTMFRRSSARCQAGL